MKPAQVHAAETVEVDVTDRPGNGSRAECRREHLSVEGPKSATRKRSKAKAVSSSVVRRSTGPRTLHGKQRSKYNALKHGIFSKALLLEDESRSEYELLLNGLREHFQPQGALETLLGQRAERKIAAAVVPPQGVAERLLRYEAHLNREIDRTLSQLERLQRMRLGQAVPPPLKVELSG